MSDSWPAPQDVVELMEQVREKFHLPRLKGVPIGINIEDSKPFNNNQLNLGGVAKVPPKYRNRAKDPIDFLMSLSADVWQDILKPDQKLALIDLHLCRLAPVYEPETVMEGKKKVVVKDEFGRVTMTETVKLDKNGDPKWQVLPLGLPVFSDNAKRFGLWYTDLQDFGEVLKAIEEQ